MTLRVAHFSDIHITARPLRLSGVDWFGKRVTGWLNARLGRGKSFRDATRVAEVLSRDLRGRAYDHVVFSGDSTTLGLAAEYEEVRKHLHLDETWPPRLAVPGNHDYYTRRAVRGGKFEDSFRPWLRGERIHPHIYPFAQQAGSFWFVAVNSAQPNLFVWDSRGRVGRAQLRRLEQLFEKLPSAPRVMVTHYPLCLADGKAEHRWRRLRDARYLREMCHRNGVCLWLHGHRHVRYHRPADERIPFAIICAGSATQAHRWSYNEYAFRDHGLLEGRHRVWSPEANVFTDGQEFSLPLAFS